MLKSQRPQMLWPPWTSQVWGELLSSQMEVKSGFSFWLHYSRLNHYGHGSVWICRSTLRRGWPNSLFHIALSCAFRNAEVPLPTTKGQIIVRQTRLRQRACPWHLQCLQCCRPFSCICVDSTSIPSWVTFLDTSTSSQMHWVDFNSPYQYHLNMMISVTWIGRRCWSLLQSLLHRLVESGHRILALACKKVVSAVRWLFSLIERFSGELLAPAGRFSKYFGVVYNSPLVWSTCWQPGFLGLFTVVGCFGGYRYWSV